MTSFDPCTQWPTYSDGNAVEPTTLHWMKNPVFRFVWFTSHWTQTSLMLPDLSHWRHTRPSHENSVTHSATDGCVTMGTLFATETVCVCVDLYPRAKTKQEVNQCHDSSDAWNLTQLYSFRKMGNVHRRFIKKNISPTPYKLTKWPHGEGPTCLERSLDLWARAGMKSRWGAGLTFFPAVGITRGLPAFLNIVIWLP